MDIEKIKSIIDFRENQEAELKAFMIKQENDREEFNDLLDDLSDIVETHRKALDNADEDNWDRSDNYEGDVCLRDVEYSRLSVKVVDDKIVVDVYGDDADDGYVNEADNFHIVVSDATLEMTSLNLGCLTQSIWKAHNVVEVELNDLEGQLRKLCKGNISHETVDKMDVVKARIAELKAIESKLPEYPVVFEYSNSMDG